MSEITFGLYRVLGNDLPPRHGEMQTFKNVEFMLDNEYRADSLTQIFCLNRIADQAKVSRLKGMLDRAGVQYITIPFIQQTFDMFEEDSARIHYLTNLNAARNQCIDHGLKQFDVAFILDGASFFRREGWLPFEELVYRFPEEAVYAVPTHRAATFEEVLSPNFQPQIRERYEFGGGVVRVGIREPYLAFTSLADVRFDESLMYGRADKAELLYRLGFPGVWDAWEPKLRAEASQKMSAFAGTVKSAGWCVRLPSHSGQGDESNLQRGHERRIGLSNILRSLKKTA